MAKFCPVRNERVVYLDCLECEGKECQKEQIKEKEKKDGGRNA